MESQFVKIQPLLGDREAIDELRRSTPGPHCQLLEVDPQACRQCEMNPAYRSDSEVSSRDFADLYSEVIDTAERMLLLDAGVTITPADMTEQEQFCLLIAQGVRRKMESEARPLDQQKAADREALRDIQKRAVREGRDA